MKIQESFKQISIHPPLPCVYYGCDKEATTAIAYEVSEHEWRMVPTCEEHTPTLTGKERLDDEARPEDAAVSR